jgi:hypothetical protein
MSALAALAAAKAANVTLTLKGDKIVLETTRPPLPRDVVELARASKRDLMRVLACREAAAAALAAEAPQDCGTVRRAYGIRVDLWDIAVAGLRRFLAEGWGDKAALMGWSADELYAVPPLWARVDLTGAALLIGDDHVVAVTDSSIALVTRSGSVLKLYRRGRVA